MLIRNIWAIGKNFREHAQEMGDSETEILQRTDPLVFLKAGSCASINSTDIQWPDWAQNVHYEVEFAFKLNSHLQCVEAAVALDLTERSLQQKAKDKGEPWTLSKSFTGACAVSSFFSLRSVPDWMQLEVKLWVNGELRQEGKISEMIHPPQMFLDYLLKHFPLCPGDLLLTGTPCGVGPLKPQDLVLAQIPGYITHQWIVQEPYKTD